MSDATVDFTPEEMQQFEEMFGADDSAAEDVADPPDGVGADDPAPDSGPAPDDPTDTLPPDDDGAEARQDADDDEGEDPSDPWESEENPYRAAAQREAEARQQREAELARIRESVLEAVERRQQAQRAKELNEFLDQASDGDPVLRHQMERQLQQAAQPWRQQAETASQAVERRARELTAFLTAAETELPPDLYKRVETKMRELVVYDDPEVMVGRARADRERNDAHAAEIAKLQAQNKRLQTQLAAQRQAEARIASGADAADGMTGGGTSDGRTRNAAEQAMYEVFGWDVSDDHLL